MVTFRYQRYVIRRSSGTQLTDVTGHDFPGAQAMLYAAGVPNKEMMKHAPQVGYEISLFVALNTWSKRNNVGLCQVRLRCLESFYNFQKTTPLTLMTTF